MTSLRREDHLRVSCSTGVAGSKCVGTLDTDGNMMKSASLVQCDDI